MSDNESSKDELEQLLRDERALRIRAETRASEQAEKAQVWRKRAEDRAARIERLVAEPKRKPRRRNEPTPAPPVQLAAEPEHGPAARPATRLASVRVAAAVAPDYELLLSPFAAEPTAGTRTGLAEADLVIVDTTSLNSMPADAAREFDDWLGAAARQPLVVIAAKGVDPAHPALDKADVVYAPPTPDVDRLARHCVPLLPVFDPSVHNPSRRRIPSGEDLQLRDRDGLRTAEIAGAVAAVEIPATAEPPVWVVEAAAQGIAVGPQLARPEDLRVAAAGARRWAFRHHTPTVRAHEITGRAGLNTPDPRPSVAAILVSMRPDQAARALRSMSQQTYRPLNVVLGLHGAVPSATLLETIDDVSAVVPVSVLSHASQLTLGECLNNAIAATGAELLAKVDDDDFYGPHHIEDAVHALEYSQAEVVGKGAQFTYIEERDATVLRRPREEETFIGGSPTGATMVFRRSLWEQVRFAHRPRQVDVLFTRSARHLGARVYANSRWEFCYVRHAAGHPWTTPAETFLAGSEPQWQGFVPSRMIAATPFEDTAAT